ncbi:MAG: DMT family transporter [Bacteroidales bacterium]|nr:DMT family transporter [Bacteroidales bacterium]
MRRDKLAGHLAVAATYTIFGLNLIFCKDIANAEAVPPIVLFTLRAAGASALFWLISLFLPGERIARGDMGLIVLASFTGLFVPQMTFLSAITMATPLDTGILGTLGPIFTMFFAFFFLKEPITFKKAGGVALSFAGVLLLVLNSVHAAGPASTTPMGFALLLLNSLSFALYLGAFRPLISRYSVVTFMKWMFLFSPLMALPFSLKGLLALDFGAIPPKVGWEIGYLIFFATFVAYFLIPFGQKRIRPTLVSLYTYLQPVIAAIISVWIGMDTLSWQKILSAFLIVAGVILVSRSRAAG